MLGTAVVTFALCLLWQPMPEVLWQADNNTLYNSLLAIGLSGWALVFYATFLINHFDLFGLRQVFSGCSVDEALQTKELAGGAAFDLDLMPLFAVYALVERDIAFEHEIKAVRGFTRVIETTWRI